MCTLKNAQIFGKDCGRNVKVIETPFINDVQEYDNQYVDTYLQGKKYVLFFGTLYIEKGILVIADILEEFLARNPNYYFVFIGDAYSINGQSSANILQKKAGVYAERVIIWNAMPHRENENVESVMLTDYPKFKPEYENKELEERWNKIIDLKEEVSKKLEEARMEKVIGHSLNAKVTLYTNDDKYEQLMKDADLLATVFIVSKVEVENNKREEDNEIGIKVEAADGEKCERCWMYSDTVGKDHTHPTLCKRCIDNLE